MRKMTQAKFSRSNKNKATWKMEAREMVRVIVILISPLALVLSFGLFLLSYVPVAYGVDGATVDRLRAILMPGRVALICAAPASIAAFIAAASNYRRFHLVAASATLAFVGVLASFVYFW